MKILMDIFEIIFSIGVLLFLGMAWVFASAGYFNNLSMRRNNDMPQYSIPRATGLGVATLVTTLLILGDVIFIVYKIYEIITLL